MNDPFICPHCNGSYTHHFKVEVYDRKEDATTGSLATVDTNGDGIQGTSPLSVRVDTDEPMDHCPSQRRGGIRVYVMCEDCDQVSHFSIVQHKGCTYVEGF